MRPRLYWRRALLVLAALIAPTVAAEDFPTPIDTEPAPTHALPASEAAARFRAPEGFHVTAFAAEPDVRNPVALAWDPRGRLWVAENYTYAETERRFDMRLRDRVLIFEDKDGDGRFDRRSVFSDDLQKLASVEIGLGGVWLLCPPQLLFVPDRNGDDVPDGPAEVVLDGFKTVIDNHHTFANGLKWGPDGWLYGRCGASSPAEVGAPGTPDAQRVPVRGGLWRYHPRKKRFEALAHGTTNPWGHDWDALGEAFFINTVNGHLWHLIPGSHLVRPHTIEPNPRAYALIDQHADHYHWDNSKELKLGTADGPDVDRRGGGHAHVGMMIYLAEQWPARYRGKLFTLNFHGRRVNVERLERAGSGFAGRHEPDMLFAADPWFRGVDLTYGPDGGVYLLDWSDTGECHEHEGVHRNSGRIFKVIYGEPPRQKPLDLRKLDEIALVELHANTNEWFVRQARRVLVDRADGGAPLVEAKQALRAQLGGAPVSTLRALWTLYSLEATDSLVLRRLLHHDHEAVRAWAIRLLTDDLPIDTIFSRRNGPDVELSVAIEQELRMLARDDLSGLVRLVLASTLQRLPVDHRLPMTSALAAHREDAADPNIPSLLWTALIPVADADPAGLVTLAGSTEIPLLARLTARRLGEDVDQKPEFVNALLSIVPKRPEVFQAEVIAGLAEALAGRRTAKKPAAWDAFVSGLPADPALRARARDLRVVFGDGRALDDVRKIALDDHAAIETRKTALQTLIDNRPPDLRSICERLVKVRYVNAVAVRGLSLFDDPTLGRSLAANYRSFHPSERAIVLETLVSRPSFARALLDQVAAGKIPREDVSAFHARQVRSFGDPALDRRLVEVWGAVRDSPSDRKAKVAALKQRLDASTLAAADRSRGRAVFDKVCASCHRLYGHGGAIGPDLTGAGRDNLDYLLENLLDPSAAVSADFRATVVALRDGRVLNGLVRARTDHTLALQTPTALLTLDRADIEEISLSSQSLMPEGLVDGLTATEARDLIAYLMSRVQVPLPTATAPR